MSDKKPKTGKAVKADKNLLGKELTKEQKAQYEKELKTLKTENKKENQKEKAYFKPTLRPQESNHYTKLWFDTTTVTKEESKTGSVYYLVNVDGNKIMFGEKAYINVSKDKLRTGFHVQNSREYRIYKTSQSITGKLLTEYLIKLNEFVKHEKEKLANKK